MKESSLREFEEFLHSFLKKNGKKLGEKTKYGVLTLAKFLVYTPKGGSLAFLKKTHTPYLKERKYPLASYALWLYLLSQKYEEKMIKEFVAFKRTNNSAMTDEEKLADSVLTKKELLYLVENIKSPRDALIVRFLYDTGARVIQKTNN